METASPNQFPSPAYLGQLEAMRKVAEALNGLPSEDVQVVLEWASRQFLRKALPHIDPVSAPGSNTSIHRDLPGESFEFRTIGDFFATAAPESGPERALVVGYWFQELQHSEDLEGAQINSELNHLGYKLPNVTATMSLLMSQKPALVVQTKKTGTAQQARKRYRLTQAGIKRVRDLLAREKGV